MSSWYSKVIRDSNDLSPVLAACDFFDSEYLIATHEVDIAQLRGQRIDEVEKRLPGIVGRRFYQLQEIEAILGYLAIRQTAIKGMSRRNYIEHYNRTLSASQVEKYVEADENALAMAELINQVAFVRNKFVGLTKEHEYLHYQLGNISRLLEAGMNDALL